MDHRLFLVILRDSLRGGATHVVESIPKREEWKGRNGHHLVGALLVSYFAYTDGLLGSNWIERLGRRQKRELHVLRVVRNALTHFNGRLSRLSKPKRSKPGRPMDPAGFVRRFAKDLEDGKILDDAGNTIPDYMKVSNGIVSLNAKAFGRLSGLFTAILTRSGQISSK